MASEVYPSPLVESRNFSGMMVTFQFDAGHALAVVAHRADDAGDVGAVAIVVHRVAVVGDEIVAVYVAAKSRPAGVGIRPDIGGQVGIGVVNARIDHRDDDVVAAGADAPCAAGRIDVGCGPIAANTVSR